MSDPSEFAEDAEFEDFSPASLESLSQDQIDETAHQLARSTNLGLQRVLLPEGATKGDAVYTLAKSVPVNDFGLPVFYYRSDLLPYNLGALTQDDADAASVFLNYDEGYPTYGEMKTWWFQLPHEAYEDYLLFKRYLECAESQGIRQLELFGQEQGVNSKKLNELRKEFYWTERCRAYDLFSVAAERRRREIRSRSMENKHFERAGELLEKLQQKIDSTEDVFANMNGKELLEAMRLGINIQRVSSGLAQNGNAGKEMFNPDGVKSAGQLMREMIESAGTHSEDGLGIDGNLMELMKDPQFALEAQSLVIRVRSSDKVEEAKQIRVIERDT